MSTSVTNLHIDQGTTVKRFLSQTEEFGRVPGSQSLIGRVADGERLFTGEIRAANFIRIVLKLRHARFLIYAHEGRDRGKTPPQISHKGRRKQRDNLTTTKFVLMETLLD